MFTSPSDDPLVIDGHFMFKLFGRVEMMEAKIMDYLISYWKDDPDMKHMFDSRERFLLRPFTIPIHAPCLLILFLQLFYFVSVCL
jgi:hypothetical protein